jgi:hypothetical protein
MIFPDKIIQLRKEKKSMAMFCVESEYEPDLDPAEPDLVPPLPPALPTQALRETQRYTEITHDPLLFSVAQGIF